MIDRRFKGHKHTLEIKPWGKDDVTAMWSLRGPRGAVHLHCSSWKRDGVTEWSCGMEFHFTERRQHEAPNYIDCPFTGGWCWHDGTSLGASEFWETGGGLQAFQRGDHRFIFQRLEMALESHMPSAETGAQE